MGDKPFYIHLKACVKIICKPKGPVDVFSRENGCFFFIFGLQENCDRVLHGPWHFDGRLIMLKTWSEKAGLERDLLSTVPIWIRSLHCH